jgi:hypothetical protein
MLGPSAAAWLGALGVLGVLGVRAGPGEGAASSMEEALVLVRIASGEAPSETPPPAAGVVLEWAAPSRCPTKSAVQDRLTRTLAGSAADPRGLRARATVTEGEGEVLELVLELDRDDGPVGRRTMQAVDCDELANAAVLIVALAVDPEAELETPVIETPTEAGSTPETGEAGEVPPVPTEPEPEPEPEPSMEADEAPAPAPAPEPIDAPAPAPAPERTDRSPRALHVGLRVGAGAGLFVLDEASAIVSAAATAWGRAFRVELGATYWTPVEVRPAGSSAGGRLQQWTIDARGCGLLRPGPLELPLCGGLDVGAIHGVGVGVSSPRNATSLRLALTAGAALVWRPLRWNERVGPWIGADLLVALVRARFRAIPAAPGLVHHTPPVGARLAAGIEVRFR